MFKGRNVLELNELTLCEAVQFWLDAQFVGKAPVISKVQTSVDTYTGSETVYRFQTQPVSEAV